MIMICWTVLIYISMVLTFEVAIRNSAPIRSARIRITTTHSTESVPNYRIENTEKTTLTGRHIGSYSCITFLCEKQEEFRLVEHIQSNGIWGVWTSWSSVAPGFIRWFMLATWKSYRTVSCDSQRDRSQVLLETSIWLHACDRINSVNLPTFK